MAKMKLAPVVREISWTQNLLIMSQAKSREAQKFYLSLHNTNNYITRELKFSLCENVKSVNRILQEANTLGCVNLINQNSKTILSVYN